MTALSTLGLLWLIFTAALAHIGIVWAASQWLRQLLDDAKRGVVERQLDVVAANKVRETIEGR